MTTIDQLIALLEKENKNYGGDQYVHTFNSAGDKIHPTDIYLEMIIRGKEMWQSLYFVE